MLVIWQRNSLNVCIGLLVEVICYNILSIVIKQRTLCPIVTLSMRWGWVVAMVEIGRVEIMLEFA